MPIDNSAATTAVRGFYDALATGDLSVLDTSLSADWEAIPALRVPGPDGWKASITNLRNAFSDITVTIDKMIVDGDMVAVLGTTRATHTGELLGVPATGREITFRSSDMHRVENGRVVQSWHLEDYFGVAQQLGLKFSL
jgi:predicted ester cyclase